MESGLFEGGGHSEVGGGLSQEREVDFPRDYGICVGQIVILDTN